MLRDRMTEGINNKGVFSQLQRVYSHKRSTNTMCDQVKQPQSIAFPAIDMNTSLHIGSQECEKG